MKPNIVMYFSPNLVKNYSHNFFPQNFAQFFSQNLVKKFTPQKITEKMALKITKFGENLVTKFSFTNFGDILVHFIFIKFGDSLKFSPNLVKFLTTILVNHSHFHQKWRQKFHTKKTIFSPQEITKFGEYFLEKYKERF